MGQHEWDSTCVTCGAAQRGSSSATQGSLHSQAAQAAGQQPTLLTRAIMANTAESAMSVARMPAAASSRAICWPWYVGAPSVTTTC